MANQIEESNQAAMEKLKDFTGAAMQGLTTDMVSDMAGKAVKMLELLDEVAQPETLGMMRKLPEMSTSLQRSLELIQRVESNGTLRTLIELSEMIGTMKASMTGPMVTDMVEKGVKGLEMADEMSQKLSPLLQPMNEALTLTAQESLNQQPPSKMQLLRSFSDPDVRAGLQFLLTFTKNLGHALQTTR
ncbi:DUF1641 domain-containing protein [Rubeoparvulum massiliense]|uniref:DUF1641 domain-containing protein n=1 Tax=Rubeoparvulum massiliense TaxID=1631346 RepID=UPI00065DDD6E|nr:DUF1641 domain-containing protein [Rubeoparvulum massiliense]